MDRVDLAERAIGAPAALLHIVSCAATVAMMAHITADVVARYAFNAPLGFTLEIVAAYYMVAVAFLSLAHVTRGEGHIRVELFTRGLSARRAAGLDAVLGILTLAFVATLTWQTAVKAIDATVKGEVWETAGDVMEIWPSHWMLPLGFGALALLTVVHVVRDFAAARTEK